MDHDLDIEPDDGFGSEWSTLSGNDSSSLSPGNKVDHIAPTESNLLLTVEQMDIDSFDDEDNEEDAAETGSMKSATDGAVDGDTTILQKLPMPAWMTDPTGRIELTGIPSVDNPHMDMEVLVHYCTPYHIEFVGLMHVKARDISRNNGESQSLQEQFYRQRRQPNVIATDIAANACNNAFNPFQQDASGSSQASSIVALHTLEAVQPVYVVFLHFQPLVEHGGSEFVSMQDRYPHADPFGIIPHYTKVFVNSADAKGYAMRLFTERTTLDYRYIVQKSWHSISSEERREAGVTPIDGPSPHLPKFKFSMDDHHRYWLIRFGCDEEYCRITVLPVHPNDPRVEGLELQQPRKRGDGDGDQQGDRGHQAQSLAPAATVE